MSAPIQIVDEQNRPTGQATQQEAWAKGLWHRVVSVMIENDRGQVLLQLRSPTKALYPNTWDPSVSGHVDAGESYEEAVAHEMAEEVGITGARPQAIGDYRSDETWQDHQLKRFNRVYKLRHNATPQNLEPGKVEEVRWFTVDEVKAMLRDQPEQVSDSLRQIVERYY